MTLDTETQLAQTITIASLRRYLLLHGWASRENIKPGIDLFHISSVDFGELEVLLPQQESRSDALRRKADALRILSQSENRNATVLIGDIYAISCDIWRAIVPSALVRHNAIPMSIAGRFIKSAKGLLASSATTEGLPKPFFERATKAGTNFAEDCRFAHTFRGSFGFSIESPIAANTSPTMAGIEEVAPFERRVMERIARGICNIAKAGESLDPILISQNYQTGFSANMCESFVDLMEAVGGQSLGFEFAFSPEWKPASDVAQKTRFEFQPVHTDLVKDAAKKLRLQEYERKRTIVGRVVKLESESDPSNLFDEASDRQIAVQWINGDFGEIKVLVTLTAAEYLAAIEAHGKGQFVSVSGLIDRMGKRWVLLEPREFRVVSQAVL